MGKLTAAKLKTLINQPGRHSDGDGLILFVRAPGQASWVARVQHNGKRRDYGLGSAKLFSLAEARDRAWEVRRALVDGRDPRTLWEQPLPMLRTFKEAAEDFITLLGAKELGEKRLNQGKSQLKRYAYPALGSLQVQTLDAERIAECLRPIWKAKPETARQVRSLIERVLRFARPDGPQFAGTLGPAISDRLGKQPAKGNHKALPYQELPAFMAKLQEKSSMGALALRMKILCASRSGEIRGATWDEIDLDRAVWTIPGERMKAGRPHRVPLTPEALAILSQASELRRAGSSLIFPGIKGDVMSDMTLTKVLRDMDMACTAHGFRSTFRDWVAEQTSTPEEVAEAALAHKEKNAVVAAYKRTDFFDRRRELMNVWARFATGQASADVVQLEVAS